MLHNWSFVFVPKFVPNKSILCQISLFCAKYYGIRDEFYLGEIERETQNGRAFTY